MKTISQFNRNIDPEIFSLTTLIYTRLRRISGRVIDAMYLAQNRAYVLHIAELIYQTQDIELITLANKLKTFLKYYPNDEENVAENNYVSEATEEEIYNAQVSHHYIGALR